MGIVAQSPNSCINISEKSPIFLSFNISSLAATIVILWRHDPWPAPAILFHIRIEFFESRQKLSVIHAQK